MQSTSDEVLIGRIANGDRLAMQVLYARYHVRVFRFVVRLVRDEATAEDVISEVFSCDGTMKAEEEQAKPHAITKLGLIVNFDAGVVTGFTGITAHIEEVNTNPVLFKGTTTHPSGVEWSVRGRIDRITGSLGATVTWFNRRTNDLLMRMNYELICKPT
jgi:Sigma-70 region 2